MREERRDVDGFPNYQVSSDGYVINKNTGRILKHRYDKYGYANVNLSRDGVCHNKRVHRIVGEAFLTQPSKEAWQINHDNGDKTDNSVGNLYYTTPSENMKHAYEDGVNHYVGYNERPVRIIETGEVFKSQAECARAIGGKRPNINACLVGRRRSHMGYHYEYADKNSKWR